MPRCYGLMELQHLVAAAFLAGHKIGRVKAVTDANDMPLAEDLLKELGIKHEKNIPFDPAKARSWANIGATREA